MKEKILKLRNEGKTYTQICKILNCSKGTVSYYCGEGQEEKTRERQRRRRKSNVLIKKTEDFRNEIAGNGRKEKVKSSKAKLIRHKADDFQRERVGGKIGRHLKKTFTYKDVTKKYGEETACYLTGRKINLQEPRTYNFDHIIPISKEGTNNFDNLGIACREANLAKSDMLVKEFLELCKDVLIHNGYKVTNESF